MAENWKKTSKDNPGKKIDFSFEYTENEEVIIIDVNLIDLLEAILEDEGLGEEGFRLNSTENFVQLNDDIIILPRLVSNKSIDENNFHTITTIEFKHKTLIPDGLFEFQHSINDDPEEGIIEGMEEWVRNILYAILDSINKSNKFTSHLKLDSDTREPRAIVLGPVTREASKKPTKQKEHPFCPCCFTTNNLKMLKPLLNSHKIFGVYYFVARNNKGQLKSDCRVNGIKFEEGEKALIEYAKSWEDLGLEFRKQYVVVTDWV